VELYTRYRPGYPPALGDFLHRNLGLTPAWSVADIGSGTGLLTRLFLDMGNQVHAVEPNPEMREAAETLLSDVAGFHSHPGSAESTGLADGSVDLVAAAQAFHWFDVEAARLEFLRILSPGGQVALIWNRRRVSGTPFLEAYEDLLLRRGLDYATVDHRKTAGPDVLARFFRTEAPGRAEFPTRQELDWQGIRGRLLSSSYTPLEGHPNHEPMLQELRIMFESSQRNGTVTVEYDTEIHYGRLTKEDQR
jgi:SAM-dependent methyltransferase